MDFGWKKKAEHLRMVIVSGGHQMAKVLPPGLSKYLEVYERVAKTGDGRGLVEELEGIPILSDEEKPLWEPAHIHGWQIQATMYRRDGNLWWLVHAQRKTDRSPSDKDIGFLNKVLDHLGAEPTRHVIIGPLSGPPGEEGRLPFGWWTWQNRWPLFEIQVNKDKKRDAEKIRIVPLGTRETEGYQALDMVTINDEDEADKEPT